MALQAWVQKCCPHGGEELDMEGLVDALKTGDKTDIMKVLLKEFVPMADDATMAALLYTIEEDELPEVPQSDNPESIPNQESVKVCQAYLEYALRVLESLYTQMDMTPRALMLNWALKGAVKGRPRSYGARNMRYWNPVEAAEHDFCYEDYLERVHEVFDDDDNDDNDDNDEKD